MYVAQAENQRALKTERLDTDLVIVGGGLAGTCAAVTAARAGLKVVLIQDRPVLGGNASSEVRLWILGATSHMGNNNRWAREGGLIDEVLVENMYRNPEGNALIFDTILLEKVANESNITLLLNTAVFEASKSAPDKIESVRAFCSQNSMMYDVHAPLFCDASGDGVLGFMTGAAFRMGAESSDEFDEGFAPDTEYGELLGHSLYFYTKNTGRPVTFVPPEFALNDITKIPRYKNFNAEEDGCQLWWIEYGGRLDTVHDTEQIKWELWKVVYGVWDYIKNSGLFPESQNLTLEWVGTIPGKRESRRFEGDYMLSQKDVIEQREHDDAVSFGGWAIDLHPADGVFSEKPGCSQWHSKGVYQIPYRCMYSKNISNLFLGGRIISATHVAFGSSRVMATCAHGGQAVAQAAALCKEQQVMPRDLLEADRMSELQRRLLRIGQHIPGLKVEDTEDLATSATTKASSQYALAGLPATDRMTPLDCSRGLLLPMTKGRVPKVSFWVQADQSTHLAVQLRGSSKPGNFTPDEVLASKLVSLSPQSGKSKKQRVLAAVEGGDTQCDERNEQATLQKVEVDFGTFIESPRYLMICLLANERVSVAQSDALVTGMMALRHKANTKVSKGGANQTPPDDIGVESFEFWLPERRPKGQLPAMRFDPPIEGFAPEQVTEGAERPTDQANAWVASLDDQEPWVELSWDAPKTISRVSVSFDTDLDHAMESVLMGHPERVMPFCVRNAKLVDDSGHTVAELNNNHQTRWTVQLDKPLTTRSLRLVCDHPDEKTPASVFRIRCFA